MHSIVSIFLLLAVVAYAMASSTEYSTAVYRYGNHRNGFIGENGPVSQPSSTILIEEISLSGPSRMLLDGERLVIGSGEVFLCIDQSDGDTLWISERTFGPFVISNGVIYAQHRDSLVWADTEIVGLDTRSGEIIWRRDLRRVTKLLVADGILYAACRSNLGVPNIITPEKIVAMRIADHADAPFVWECELPDYTVRALSQQDTILVASLKSSNSYSNGMSDGIAAISTISGDLLWTIDTDSITNSCLPLTEEALFYRVPNTLKAVSITKGSLIWSRPDSLICDPVIWNSIMFYLIKGGELIAVDTNSGKRISSCTLPAGTVRRGSTITLSLNGIYINSGSLLLKLDYDLELNWIYSSAVTYPMIIRDSVLYFLDYRFFTLSDS